MQSALPEGQVEHGAHGLGRQAPPARGWIEHPADLGGEVRAVGQPQRHVPDDASLVLDHERERSLAGVESGPREPLLDPATGVLRRPRLLEQVTGDVGARVDREQRLPVLLVVEAQAQTVRVHGEVDGAWQLAHEGDELDGLA